MDSGIRGPISNQLLPMYHDVWLEEEEEGESSWTKGVKGKTRLGNSKTGQT